MFVNDVYMLGSEQAFSLVYRGKIKFLLSYLPRKFCYNRSGQKFFRGL